MTEPVHPPEASTPAPSRPSRLRALILFLVFAFVVVAAVSGLLWYRAHSGVSTDDAFIRADVARISSEVGGRVVGVEVTENQHVQAGDLLLVIDDEPYQMRVRQAEAAVTAAEADAERAEAGAQAARAQVRLAEAQLAQARREEKLQTDLVSAGSSVEAAQERAEDVVHVAEAAVSAARKQAESAGAAADAARAHIEAARTAVALAERDVAHTRVVAPVSGIATRVEVVPGDLVRPGQSLFAVVPTEVYVVANFKETQLENIRIGDPVELWVDAYPDVELRGTVQSIGAGTASAFSLLPADNPSGNFVKVVQRVPVRIALDGADPPDAPLAVGLSVVVRVRPSGRGSG